MGKVIRGMLQGTAWTPLAVFLSLALISGTAGADLDKKQTEIRKKIEAKRTELNGGEWQVTIKSLSGKGALDGADVLTFQDNLFKSQASSKLGFTPTNYSLTVPESEEGPTVWETMQTGSKGEAMFWRGEWFEKNMTGVITRQIDEEKSEEYRFSSSVVKEISETSETPESQDAEKAKKEEKTDSKGKKKKGWF